MELSSQLNVNSTASLSMTPPTVIAVTLRTLDANDSLTLLSGTSHVYAHAFQNQSMREQVKNDNFGTVPSSQSIQTPVLMLCVILFCLVLCGVLRWLTRMRAQRKPIPEIASEQLLTNLRTNCTLPFAMESPRQLLTILEVPDGRESTSISEITSMSSMPGEFNTNNCYHGRQGAPNNYNNNMSLCVDNYLTGTESVGTRANGLTNSPPEASSVLVHMDIQAENRAEACSSQPLPMNGAVCHFDDISRNITRTGRLTRDLSNLCNEPREVLQNPMNLNRETGIEVAECSSSRDETHSSCNDESTNISLSMPLNETQIISNPNTSQRNSTTTCSMEASSVSVTTEVYHVDTEMQQHQVLYRAIGNREVARTLLNEGMHIPSDFTDNSVRRSSHGRRSTGRRRAQRHYSYRNLNVALGSLSSQNVHHSLINYSASQPSHNESNSQTPTDLNNNDTSIDSYIGIGRFVNSFYSRPSIGQPPTIQPQGEGVVLEQWEDGSQIVYHPPPTLPPYDNESPPPYQD